LAEVSSPGTGAVMVLNDSVILMNGR
jgi:hypothetical protein